MRMISKGHKQQCLLTGDFVYQWLVLTLCVSITTVTLTSFTGWRPSVVDWGIVCLLAANCGSIVPLCGLWAPLSAPRYCSHCRSAITSTVVQRYWHCASSSLSGAYQILGFTFFKLVYTTVQNGSSSWRIYIYIYIYTFFTHVDGSRVSIALVRIYDSVCLSTR